ncbi:MAG: pilin [Candidatus Shapirobacteria bacterium]|nr:pilin [Candidatus Shapirobacteria bacterium]
MNNVLNRVGSAILGVVYAQEIAIQPPDSAGTLNTITVENLISGTITLVFIAASLVFFFMLVAGGIKWMMAGGDKEKAGEARSQLTSALIGLIVIFLAWAISKLLETLFGVNILGGFRIPNFFGPAS